MPRETYILDTSAVIAGFVPGLSNINQVTIQEVLDEARDLCSKLELETAVTAGKVEVIEPSIKALGEVRRKVRETGDRVSETDVKLLALALDLHWTGREPKLLTDDYAIQNLASLLGVPYQRIAMPGITEVLRWQMICPACGRKYMPTVSRCEICGTGLIRKPRR